MPIVAGPATSLVAADSCAKANHNYEYKNISASSSQHEFILLSYNSPLELTK